MPKKSSFLNFNLQVFISGGSSNIPLFIRNRHGIKLTPQGLKIFPDAQNARIPQAE
jgi:hypothetical protein